MNNPFQEQLLKAGLVTKEQVQKAQKEKHNKNKQKKPKKERKIDEGALKAKQLAAEKAKQDRELNQKKQDQARQKAISIEINQLIGQHKIKRHPDWDIAYRFEHQGKVKTVYIDEACRQKLARGQYGIARIEGHYELVPLEIAKKIAQRNNKRIILIDPAKETPAADKNDPYADFQVPDDLIW